MSLKKKKHILSAMKARPSLADDIDSSNASRVRPGKKRKMDDKDDTEMFVDSKLTKKILLVAQQQLNESHGQGGNKPVTSTRRKLSDASGQRSLRHGTCSDSDDNDNDEWEDVESADDNDADEADPEADPGYDPADDLSRQLYTDEGGPLGQLDAEQLRALIAEKRTELESELLEAGGDSEAGASRVSCLPDTIREHFESCRAVLRQYRSGKLPKPIKQLPHFAQWQELVELLEPGSWTAAAMCAVTKYFTAKGKATALQFFQGYLLPRCRDDITEYRRLNFHLYSALRKAMFRQREFFCGLLLPWAKAAVSLPEATILGGLLRRVSIPVKYAAPALHMLLQMPYSGGRAILVRVLLEKKYNLPDPVLGQALAHFVAMETDYADHLNEDGRLPVLWHQALLALVERYGAYLSQEERDRLLRLCKRHQHPEITQQVRRALGQLQQRDARGDSQGDG